MLEKILLVANASEYGIVKFLEFAGTEIEDGEDVLDAGAGLHPYHKLFAHASYQSCDISGKHDFICSLEAIPVADASYDTIINTQVLEHVESPEAVLREFYRILRHGGKLFLTAPQGWGEHGDNYFNFLSQGLRLLFERVGFQVMCVIPLGGIFWLTGKRYRDFPWYVYRQYVFRGNKFHPSVGSFVLAPFFILALPFCRYIIPWLCFWLDRLDRDKKWTLNYGCYGVKLRQNGIQRGKVAKGYPKASQPKPVPSKGMVA